MSSTQITFFDSKALGPELEDRVMWAAGILLQLTAGCSFAAFSGGKILARWGKLERARVKPS